MTCEICKGTRHVRKPDGSYERCICMGTLKAEQALKNSNLPESLRKLSLSSLDNTKPQHKRFLLHLKGIKEDFNPTSIVMISSPTIDREKFAVVLALFILSLNDGFSSLSYHQLDSLVVKYFGNEKELIDSDVLLLQVGNEQTNSAHASYLYDLIYNRLLSEKYTILISSLSEQDFLRLYYQKSFDLVKQNGSYLVV